jgi:hypothetical protein
MANGGQFVAGFEEELFDEAPFAIWADIEGMLFVMKLPQIAIRH